MNRKILATLSGLVAGGLAAQADVTFIQVTGDADSGIDSAITYTHAVDFGNGAPPTVNGVPFAQDMGTAAGAVPNGGVRTYGPNSHGGNAPPAVTGSIADVFRDMRYNGPNGAGVELTGLTPGQWYDLRFYDRAWDFNGSIRPATFSYDVDSDGSVEFISPTFDTNRPNTAPLPFDANVSWVTSYIYQAGANGSITVSIGIGGTGTYHIYGLTNAETIPPTDPPVLTATNPADDATGVETYSNLEATFDKGVRAGAGNIRIRNLTDGGEIVIPVGDAQVSILGDVLMIDPDTNLLGEKDYAVRIDAGALEDSFGNPFGGIGDDTTWNFTTAVADVTAPAVALLVPTGGALGVSGSSDLVLTFDEPVQLGSGTIEVRNLFTDALMESVDVASGAVTVNGSEVRIDLLGTLPGQSAFYVTITAGSIEDLSGNPYAGISGQTGWTFGTGEAGEFSVVAITDDSDSGIDAVNTYTHALDFGQGNPGALINGVEFQPYNGGANGTLDFNRTIESGTANDHPGNAGHNVTGGLIDLMTDMYYNGGNVGGGRTTWTLSGLTAGVTYETRIYGRQWGPNPGRIATFLFDPDGPGPIADVFGPVNEDDATTMGLANANDAYYIGYRFTAVEGQDLTITLTQPNTNQSWHLYGLTNQVVPVFRISATPLEFTSAVTENDLIASLSGAFNGTAEATTFALVAGDGDFDNAKFKIGGQQLQAGSYDFSADADRTYYSVRIRGTGNVTGEIAERNFLLVLNGDSDADNLPDDWELANANDLTELSGLGGANFDGDTLTDLEEYQISISSYPGINPKAADTDGDGLEDGSEILGAGARPGTDPTLADTDGDGLSDLVESNTNAFTDANDTGSNPIDADTDGDTVPDGLEVVNGSDPNDPASFLPSSISVRKITSDVSTGINPLKTYTHLISGGNAATVNGVFFEALTPTVTPANFDWDGQAGGKNQVLDTNNNWDPFLNGLDGTEIEQLLDSFTYSGAGATPGSSQTFTLSGLTPGETYQLRFYIRIWADATERPILFRFTNGGTVFDPMIPLPEDRPGLILGTGDDDCAYYLAYQYTAESSELVVDATVAPGGNGSFHLYGLSNEVFQEGFYAFGLDNTTFGSWNGQGDPVGILSAFLEGTPETSTFSLVAGPGSDDNDKFQISGDQLELGSFDFTGANSTNGQQFLVRIRGEGAGGASREQEFVLTITKDDDQDGLIDEWELMWAGNINDLDGNGNADFDNDFLTDLDEYELFLGLIGGPYPLLDPTKADTDGDGIEDGDEVFPLGLRPPTDPTKVDTDDDGLSDGAETNTFVFVDANDTGTDPSRGDSDGDGFGDGDEVAAGTDPNDPSSRPPFPANFEVVQVTDDATAGIDAAKVYTHAVSGGTAATVNGVDFEVLSPTQSPANLVWDTQGFAMSQVLNNNGEWDPVMGGLTGAGLQSLLGSFTYSSNGANPGGLQSFTLTGLTPGQAYQVRLYLRPWGLAGDGRPIAVTFVNGNEVARPSLVLPEDRPGDVLQNGNLHAAYYLGFTYIAQSTELVINANVPLDAPTNSGSYHMYALSNEQTEGGAPPSVRITNIVRVATGPSAGAIVIQFEGAPNTTYAVTKSPDLVAFGPLSSPLSVTTDGGGLGQAIIPAAEVDPAADASEFYRLEE